MTPQEKAKELIDKFISIGCLFANAKKCAIIAVDEIINTLNKDIRDLDVRGNILLDLIEKWQSVKTEINKL